MYIIHDYNLLTSSTHTIEGLSYQTDEGTASTLVVFLEIFSSKPEVEMLHHQEKPSQYNTGS